MTTIRYFIPEDGDDELHPNVFLAPKSRQPGAPPTLLAVKDSFPLPGHYHFRFKSPLFPGADREKGAMAVWMDVTKDQELVPTWKNTIVAKVTRLSMEEEDDDDDEDHHFLTPSAASSAPPVQATHSHASSNVSASSGDHLDMFFDNQSPPPNQQQQSHHHHQQQPPQQPGQQPNLFDSHPPSAPSTGGSLLDFGASPAPAPAVHSDFLGMTAPSSGGAPQPRHQPPQPQFQQPQQQQGQSFQSYPQQGQPFADLGAWS